MVKHGKSGKAAKHKVAKVVQVKPTMRKVVKAADRQAKLIKATGVLKPGSKAGKAFDSKEKKQLQGKVAAARARRVSRIKRGKGS